MVNVIVTGIPNPVPLPKFLKFIKRAILRCKKEIPVNFYHATSDKFNEISFSLNFKQALKAKKSIDGFLYIHQNRQYPLQCWLDNLEEEQISLQHLQHQNYAEMRERDRRENRKDFRDDRDMQQERDDRGMQQVRKDRDMQQETDARGMQQERDDRDMQQEIEDYRPPHKSRRYDSPAKGRRSRSRSCGSHQSSELKTIELKIELIKKQRILMEEETKLLLEKKKLEYLQNVSCKDYEKLEQYEKIVKGNDPKELSEFLAKRHSKKSELRPVPAVPKLPSFLGPCKMICAEMKGIIQYHKGLTAANLSLFHNLLRSKLKKRLVFIMEGEEYRPIKEVVSLYRTHHPKSSDREFVDELVKTITTCYWSHNERAKLVLNCNEGKISESHKSAGCQVQKNDDYHGDSATTDINIDELIDLDEFIDLEDDVENWADDECNEAGDTNSGEQSQDFVIKEPTSTLLTAVNKVEVGRGDERVQDIKIEDITKDNKNEDIAKDNENEDIAKDNKNEDITKDNKNEDIAKDNKNEDIAKDNKNEDIAKDNKNEDITKDNKNEDIAKDNKNEDIAKDNKNEDIAKDNKNEDITKDYKNEDIAKDTKIEDITKDNSEAVLLEDAAKPEQESAIKAGEGQAGDENEKTVE